MEKIMSKTNDTSNITMLDNHRPLADSELDAVSGGMGFGPMWFQVQAMQQMADEDSQWLKMMNDGTGPMPPVHV
jgi:hypothetical protein